MSGTIPFRDAIRHRIGNVPALRPIASDSLRGPHTKKMDRYISSGGHGLAHEHNHTIVQHLWVRLDQIDPRCLTDILNRTYPAQPFGEKRERHSNVDGIPGFHDATLIRFTPEEIAHVDRIIASLLDGESGR